MFQEQSRLLALSTEVLLLILEQLPNLTLLEISKASRRLHYLALPMYLSRYGIPSPDPTSLVLQGSILPVLAGLRASFSITSLDLLSCKFEGPDEAMFAAGVTHLLRFVHKLTKVHTVTLHMGSIDARWIDGLATTRSAAWKPTFLRLLDMLLARQCSSLTIAHGHFMSPFLPLDPKLVGNSASVRATFLGVSLNIGRPRPLIERGLSRNELKSFSIHSSMLLLQPFYAWTLRTLSTCNIRSLSIRLSGIPLETWALILSTITVPSLVEFTAENTDIAFPDLINFFSRHPSIDTLNLHPHFSYSHSWKRPKWPMKKRLLPQLTALSGSRSNITALLGHLRPPPQLHSIALSLPTHQRVFQISDFEHLNRHITDVLHTIAPVVLALKFSVPYETSASAAPEPKGDTIITVFRTVQTLAFSTDGRFAFAKWVLPALPSWLANFVSLRHIQLADDCAPIEPERQEHLAGLIKQTCPWIQAVAFGDIV